MGFFTRHLLTAFALISSVAGAAVWETLPPTPSLPGNPAGARTRINGVYIWHAEFGTLSDTSIPVLMLHGGFGNSDYYGDVIELLMKDYYVIAMDTRGHGRSSMDDTPFSYELYASDAAGLLSSLGITKAAWVGWSDMGAGTYAALMDSGHSSLIERAFVYGGFHSVDSTNSSFTTRATYKTFIERAAAEYTTLQPDGNLTAFAAAVEKLESTQPNWTGADFSHIALGSRVAVVGGEFEEAVVLTEPALLQGWIWGSQLLTLANVSHFAPVQDPEQFAAKIVAFLES